MKKLPILLLILSILVLGTSLVLAQHSGHGGASNSQDDLVARGRDIFVSNNCTACHGQNAEGTDIAPALAGHSEFAIRRQVRAPIGVMLVFNPTVLPEEDLQALVAYIQSLPMMESMDAHEHGTGIPAGDILFAHHWLLWLALERGNQDAALHELAHINEMVESIHLIEMQAILTAVSEGDLESAQTLLEPMVTNVGNFSADAKSVALQMVYLAVTNGDVETAQHFVNHYADFGLSESEQSLSDELSHLLETCNFDETSTLLSQTLGDDLHFVPMEMDEMMNMDSHGDDEHDEADSETHTDEHGEDSESYDENTSGCADAHAEAEATESGSHNH